MQAINTWQVLPAWTPEAGEMLLCQVEQVYGISQVYYYSFYITSVFLIS